MASNSQSERAKARASWPVQVYTLGEEPGEDLSASTTVEQRLAMMWPLALESWTFSSKPLPSYTRETMPVSTRRLRD
jgi:hypothetical protein